MSQDQPASLQAIHDQLATILEDRVTELMTQIKTSQALARQIARTEEEIERHRMLVEQITADLEPLRAEAAELTAQASALQDELDQSSDGVTRLKALLEELASSEA